MVSKEHDILRDAVIDTEKEIYASAFGEEPATLDETGDQSREAMGEGLEGQHEADGDDETDNEGETSETVGDSTVEATTAKTEESKVEDESKGPVPGYRLREQTERTRAAETERDALKARLEAAETESIRKIDALRAEFQAALRQQPRPADQPKPAETKVDAPPDLFENPQAFAEYVQNQAKAVIAAERAQMREERINASMQMAKDVHKETFDKAFAALKEIGATGPDGRAMVQRIVDTPNPGQAVVDWHKRRETLREVGDDPAAYKTRVAEETRKALASDPEFRKQILAALHAEAMGGDNGIPRTSVRLPPSLNRAAGGNSHAPNDISIFDGSDQAIFASAFKD